MKLEMDARFEGAIRVTAICICIVLVAYFIIVVWWAGLNDNKREIELRKAEACYTEYVWSEISKTNNVKTAYCREGSND